MWKLVSNRLPDVRQMMFSGVKRELEAASILPGDPYHKDGGVIIRELLKKGCISKNTYRGLIDVVTGKKLLETNVFSSHVNSEEISFQSTLVKRYCEEKSTTWEEKE